LPTSTIPTKQALRLLLKFSPLGDLICPDTCVPLVFYGTALLEQHGIGSVAFKNTLMKTTREKREAYLRFLPSGQDFTELNDYEIFSIADAWWRRHLRTVW
jgi:hypothetical protein